MQFIWANLIILLKVFLLFALCKSNLHSDFYLFWLQDWMIAIHVQKKKSIICKVDPLHTIYHFLEVIVLQMYQIQDIFAERSLKCTQLIRGGERKRKENKQTNKQANCIQNYIQHVNYRCSHHSIATYVPFMLLHVLTVGWVSLDNKKWWRKTVRVSWLYCIVFALGGA